MYAGVEMSYSSRGLIQPLTPRERVEASGLESECAECLANLPTSVPWFWPDFGDFFRTFFEGYTPEKHVRLEREHESR
jgi:hypothetical protein